MKLQERQFLFIYETNIPELSYSLNIKVGVNYTTILLNLGRSSWIQKQADCILHLSYTAQSLTDSQALTQIRNRLHEILSSEDASEHLLEESL
jgi:hypothetical protein